MNPVVSNPSVLDCLIVGAGFSGLGTAIQLKRRGRENFLILEKAGEVGGAWRENHYPGCACDIPSHLYSFSFEQNPHWTRAFAPQGEIFAYLKRCTERYGLAPHLRFHQELQEARFDVRAGHWRVTTWKGDLFFAKHLVLGVGALHEPSLPQLPGLERFKGPSFHSAQWRHDVPLEGKDVAVVGTGASAIQFVPQLAPQARRLSIFQRTPPWIMPKPDRAITRFERAIFKALPFVQRLYRYGVYWAFEGRGLGFTVHPNIMKLAAHMGRRHLEAQVQSPALREKLTPSYLPGCKRVLISNDYYPALERPNVSLVTEPIREVTPDGLLTEDGVLHPAGVLIFGTGFRVTELLSKVNIVGLEGRTLSSTWEGGIEAYMGTMLSGFPNLFVLTGPNTGLGHNSMIFMIESQIRLILDQMDRLDANGGVWMDVLPSAQREWNDRLAPRLKRSIWATGCRSWYLDRNGRNSALWPGFTFEFWARTRNVDATHLHFEPRPHEGSQPASVPQRKAS